MFVRIRNSFLSNVTTRLYKEVYMKEKKIRINSITLIQKMVSLLVIPLIISMLIFSVYSCTFKKIQNFILDENVTIGKAKELLLEADKEMYQIYVGYLQ